MRGAVSLDRDPMMYEFTEFIPVADPHRGLIAFVESVGGADKGGWDEHDRGDAMASQVRKSSS